MTIPSPDAANSDLAAYLVRVAGKALPDAVSVTRIEIVSEVNRIPFATVELVDGEPAQGNFAISGGSLFTPGAVLSIELGYHGTTSQVFSGLITAQSIRSHGGSASSLSVEAHHTVVKSSLGRKNAVYTQQTDADVITRLLDASGVSASVEGSGSAIPQLVQYYATDWDFIVARAEANGWVVCALPNKVTVGKPDDSADAVLSLTYGLDVLDFELELDALSQVAKIECQAWSHQDQTMISANSSGGSVNGIGQYGTSTLADAVGNGRWILQSCAGLEQAELSAWADAEYARRAFAKLQGIIRFQGSKLVAPGTMVELSGFGKTFNGQALVGGVRQLLDRGGHWTTEVRLGLKAVGFTSRVAVAAPMAAGLVPGAQGLLNGVVRSITDDPTNSYRVQVEVPLLGTASNTLWARLGSFYASNGVGAVFFPEVGDEVIVGFINADPSSAIILGSVYSGSKLVPPLAPDAQNSKKGFVTKQKIELIFDESMPSVSISTPGGRKFVLDDKGKTVSLEDNLGNSLKMSESGITMSTSKKFTLSADEGVSISTSSGDVSIAASAGAAKASALQIQLTGEQTFQATGNMTATLQSDLETVVKGLMVKIN